MDQSPAPPGLPRILCIADGPNWIFNRHILALQQHLGDRFAISAGYRGAPYDEDEYDLIYPLEFNMVDPERIRRPQKYVTGIRSFVAWADWDFLVLVNFLVTHFQRVHVVSRQLHDLFAPYIPDVAYVTHGVDTDFFQPERPPGEEAGRLRLGWAGNRKTYVKGFADFIAPLASVPGVELVYHGVADRQLTYEEMPAFYQSIDAFASASSFEGSNNTLLEAAAMQRAIITTRNGTVPEYLEDGRSALLVERDAGQFRAAIERLRDDPPLRRALGSRAREAVVTGGWDWRQKAAEYGDFFAAALERAHQPLPADRVVIDPPDLPHHIAVLQAQYRLERELRIGHAYQEIELSEQARRLEAELAACVAARAALADDLELLKQTRAYRLDAWMKATRLYRLLRRPGG